MDGVCSSAGSAVTEGPKVVCAVAALIIKSDDEWSAASVGLIGESTNNKGSASDERAGGIGDKAPHIVEKIADALSSPQPKVSIVVFPGY